MVVFDFELHMGITMASYPYGLQASVIFIMFIHFMKITQCVKPVKYRMTRVDNISSLNDADSTCIEVGETSFS